MTDPAAQITSLEHIKKFITAGDALFTLVSKKTGERKTFLVEEKHHETHKSTTAWGGKAWFVRLLVGPENSSDYRYLGFLYEKRVENTNVVDLHFKINKHGWGQDAAASFEWMLKKINFGLDEFFFNQAEFWHAGRCGRCGRTLTVPESIATGIGPVCAGRS